MAVTDTGHTIRNGVDGVAVMDDGRVSGKTGDDGQVMTMVSGTPEFADIPASGTVTSVDVSGGTTGLTTSGGPVTGSGTITLAGTLAVTNGGTGATDASTARTNLGLNTTANQTDSTNKRFVTDAELTVLGNTSGTNTGDQTIALTGDVTGSGTGSFGATITNSAVTLAKIANASANDKLLGSGNSGSGSSYAEIGLSGGLTMSGTTLSSANTGGWTSLFVSGSNFTTNSTTQVDITGLSFSASASTIYEIELSVRVGSSTNAGVQMSMKSTGTSPSVQGFFAGITNNAAVFSGRDVNDTAQSSAIATNSQIAYQKMWFLIDSGTGSPVISARISKNTSGTATVYIGSVMRYRVFGT